MVLTTSFPSSRISTLLHSFVWVPWTIILVLTSWASTSELPSPLCDLSWGISIFRSFISVDEVPWHILYSSSPPHFVSGPHRCIGAWHQRHGWCTTCPNPWRRIYVFQDFLIYQIEIQGDLYFWMVWAKCYGSIIWGNPYLVLPFFAFFNPSINHQTRLNRRKIFTTTLQSTGPGSRDATMPFKISHLWTAPEVNPINRKARSIPVLNPYDKYGRTFFFSWSGFLVAFLSW